MNELISEINLLNSAVKTVRVLNFIKAVVVILALLSVLLCALRKGAAAGINKGRKKASEK